MFDGGKEFDDLLQGPCDGMSAHTTPLCPRIIVRWSDVLACKGLYTLIPVPFSVVVDVNEVNEAGIRFGREVGLARGESGAVGSSGVDRFKILMCMLGLSSWL